MPIKTGPALNDRDVFIDYDFEEVMFRRESVSKKIFRTFYGEKLEVVVDYGNNLFSDALRYGVEITGEIYFCGK